MLTLGVIGSTELNDDEKEVVSNYVCNFFDKTPDITLLLHLHSTGVEEIVCEIAGERGIQNESIPIYHYTWNGDLKTGTLPGGFKDANIKIIEQADQLLVVTTHRDKSGGPLWSAKRARKQRKPVTQYSFSIPPPVPEGVLSTVVNVVQEDAQISELSE